MIQTDKIRELSEKDDLPTTIKFMKLVEEVGELSQIMLAAEGLRNASYSLSKLTEDERLAGVEEEIIDSLICILDLAHKVGLCDYEINNIIEQKTAKWERKLV